MAVTFGSAVTIAVAGVASNTGSITPVAGDTMVIAIGEDAGTATSNATVSDSKGNTWTQAFYMLTSTGGFRVMYAKNVAAGATTITVAYSQTNGTNCAAVVQRFGGVDTTAPLDVVKQGTSASTTTPTSGTSATTAQADEMVVGCLNISGAATTVSLGSGYTNLTTLQTASSAAGAYVSMESKVVAVTGTQTATFGLAAARASIAALITLKAAATGTNYTATPTDPVGITDSTALDRGRTSTDPIGLTDSYTALVPRGKVGLVVDNFDDNTVNTTLWPDVYGGASEVGGRARVPAVAGVFAGYKTNPQYDGTASRIQVRMYRNAAGGATEAWGRVMLWSGDTAGTGIGWWFNAVTGQLVAESYISYFDAAPTTLADNPTTMAYVRIEEAGGTVTLSTSPDGTTFTSRRTITTPGWFTNVYVALEGYRLDGTADFLEYDDFDVTGNYLAGPTDPIGLTDSAAAVAANIRTATDVVGLTDSATAVVSLDVPGTHPIGITDSVTTLYAFGYLSTTTHPIGLTDSTTIVQTGARTATDPIGLTDSAAIVQTNVRTPVDPIGLTDSATAVRGSVASAIDPIGLTDSFTAIITDEHAGEWQYIFVPWGTGQITIPDLTPGMTYDLQIRAMDASGNASAWSLSTDQLGALDTAPPSTPAAPTVVSSAIALQVSSTLGKATGGTYNLESDLALLEVHASSTSGFTPTTATKIGTMAADVGIMTAATPAIATFKTDAVVAQYVRIIAIDKTGNRSPASATASAVPGLIDSAHISDLTASKITAGTVGADIIVGARIKTANSGARVELNTAGIQAFNTGGTQTVGISSADGSAFITGTLKTGNASTRIEIVPNAGAPVIYFYPSSSTNYGFLNGVDNGSNVFMGLNSSEFGTAPNDYQHRIWLTNTSGALQTMKPVTQVQRGGIVYTDTGGSFTYYKYDGSFGGFAQTANTYSRIGAYNTGGTVVSSLQFNGDSSMKFVGKFSSSGLASTDALYSDYSTIGGGFSGISVGYGSTMSSAMAPLYGILRGAPDFFHCISSSSNTGFTVSWGPTDGTSTYTAKEVAFWSFRY